jgi:hypothetical protein
MSVVTDYIGKSLRGGPGRRVSIRRDEEDFVIAFQPENFVIFRHQDADALSRVCRSLQWELVNDTSLPENDFTS